MLRRDIWLVTAGENHMLDGGTPRLMRTGQLAVRLARRGHRITWWASAFDHSRRRHRAPYSVIVECERNLRYALLHGTGYSKNVSLARLWDHAQLAAEFAVMARDQPPPDVIVAAMPTIELAFTAVLLGRTYGIGTIVDIRDFWPEIFLEAAPNRLRGIARIALSPYFAMRNAAVRGATAVTGISDKAVEWAIRVAGRARSPNDRAFVLAYDRGTAGHSGHESPVSRPLSTGNRAVFRAAFVGTMSRRLDIDTCVRGASVLNRRMPGRFEFVFAGRGEALDRLRSLARDLGAGNCSFPGWLDQAEIDRLLRSASIGLLPYPSTSDFLRSFPNKFAEYLSYGLPVVTCLGGLVGELIDSDKCGHRYATGDPESLVSAVLHLAGDQRRFDAMRHRASEVFAARFDADTVYREYADFIVGLASRRGQRTHLLPEAESLRLRVSGEGNSP